jgi:hypothetical protein
MIIRVDITTAEALDFTEFLARCTPDRLEPFTWHSSHADNTILVAHWMLIFGKLADALEAEGYSAVRRQPL